MNPRELTVAVLRELAADLDELETAARQHSNHTRCPVTEWTQHVRADAFRDVAAECRTAALRIQEEVRT